jgi:hypothetical protein
VAVVGRAVATSQARTKSAEALCVHLVHAWDWLGLPTVSQMDNEMAASGGGRHPYAFSLVMRLHLLLGVHLLFIPPRANPAAMPMWRASTTCGKSAWCATPAPTWPPSGAPIGPSCATTTSTSPTAPWPPIATAPAFRVSGWSCTAASCANCPRDSTWRPIATARARLQFPLARGRVSFVRKVNDHGFIQVSAQPYFIGKRLARQYVTATVYTQRQQLVIKIQRNVHKRFEFPISEPLVPPLATSAEG